MTEESVVGLRAFLLASADARKIAIEGTLIRVPKVGLIVQPHTKSKAGMRTIVVPVWVMGLLRRHHADSAGEWVFPSTAGTLRDPDNTRKQLREVLGDTRWKGLHPHAFRQLIATRLDAKGLSARVIAHYLGHERISISHHDWPDDGDHLSSYPFTAMPERSVAASRYGSSRRRSIRSGWIR